MSYYDGPDEDGTDLNDIEAMIRAAGDHVVPSRDLRPRLLESVRIRRRAEQRRQWITAVSVPSLVFVAALSNHAMQARDVLSEASSPQRLSRAVNSAAADSSGNRIDRQFWGLADAFSLLQRQRADAFSGRSSAEPLSEESSDLDQLDEQKRPEVTSE